MIKIFVLFIVTLVFMFLAFAANYYLDGLWYKTPTVISVTAIAMFNLFFLIDGISSHNWKVDKKQKDGEL